MTQLITSPDDAQMKLPQLHLHHQQEQSYMYVCIITSGLIVGNFLTIFQTKYFSYKLSGAPEATAESSSLSSRAPRSIVLHMTHPFPSL